MTLQNSLVFRASLQANDCCSGQFFSSSKHPKLVASLLVGSSLLCHHRLQNAHGAPHYRGAFLHIPMEWFCCWFYVRSVGNVGGTFFRHHRLITIFSQAKRGVCPVICWRACIKLTENQVPPPDCFTDLKKIHCKFIFPLSLREKKYVEVLIQISFKSKLFIQNHHILPHLGFVRVPKFCTDKKKIGILTSRTSLQLVSWFYFSPTMKPLNPASIKQRKHQGIREMGSTFPNAQKSRTAFAHRNFMWEVGVRGAQHLISKYGATA